VGTKRTFVQHTFDRNQAKRRLGALARLRRASSTTGLALLLDLMRWSFVGCVWRALSASNYRFSATTRAVLFCIFEVALGSWWALTYTLNSWLEIVDAKVKPWQDGERFWGLVWAAIGSPRALGLLDVDARVKSWHYGARIGLETVFR